MSINEINIIVVIVMSNNKTKLKEDVISFISTSIAGIILIFILYPLDSVKTRLQLQSKFYSKNEYHYYSGILDCLVKMYKHEGPLSYWKGVLPAVIIHAPRRAFKFFMFEEYKNYFSRRLPHSSSQVYVCGAAATGLSEALLITPFEVIKITQQANRAKINSSPSAWSAVEKILSEGGFGRRGLYRGLTATMMRSSSFNVLFFGIFYSSKDFISVHANRKATFLEKVLFGLTASITATTFTYPIDLAKSKIQGPQPEPNKIKYKWATSTIVTTYKEDGFRALYRGLGVQLLKVGPGGTAMLLIIEYINKYLSEFDF